MSPSELDGYFARIEYAGPRAPTGSVLDAIHAAHATHIPFENVDVLLRRPIALDVGSLHRKLVTERRGGYCFEQNALFADALETLGFGVTRVAARVRVPPGRPTSARLHMVVVVDVDDGRVAADVGFGALGLLTPIGLQDGARAQQGAWMFGVRREAETFVVWVELPGGPTDLYAFTLEPQLPVDYDVANHFTSTHPSSPFVQRLTAQRVGVEERLALRGRTLEVWRRDASSIVELRSSAEVAELLRTRLSVVLPQGVELDESWLVKG